VSAQTALKPWSSDPSASAPRKAAPPSRGKRFFCEPTLLLSENQNHPPAKQVSGGGLRALESNPMATPATTRLARSPHDESLGLALTLALKQRYRLAGLHHLETLLPDPTQRQPLKLWYFRRQAFEHILDHV